MAALSALVSGLVACSPATQPDAEPVAIPLNDTPENTIIRFMAVYEAKDLEEYRRLLTGDFTFEFSNAADPDLVQRYSTGWFKADEVEAARKLFEAASRIELSIQPTTPVADTGAGRDPLLYKMLAALVRMHVQLETGDDFVCGEGVPQFHRFFLVRGDEAQGLDDDQPADSSRWYIWNWRDESPPLSKPHETAQTPVLTWGQIKAAYR